MDRFAVPDHWLFDCRFRHHCQASIPTPAKAAFRNLLEPNVSFRTLRRVLFPKPNIFCLLCAGARAPRRDDLIMSNHGDLIETTTQDYPNLRGVQ